jgi:RHO1 GDP-GTP exchange protein 1/2
MVYPCTIHHDSRLNGQFGGLCTLFAESAQARSEWKVKLEEAIGLRKVVQESNRVFGVETLSVDISFAVTHTTNVGSSRNDGKGSLTGKVTCSVPFSAWSGTPPHSLC